MGQDKALMPVNGIPLAVHVAQAVKRAVKSATLVGSKEKYGSLGLTVVEDVYPGHGPLSGIHAALSASTTPLNLIVGCDMPFLSTDFLEHIVLIAAVADAQVTVAESTEFGYEALCAVFNREVLPAIEDCLKTAELKLSRVYERLHVRTLSPEEWRPFNPQGVLFHNVNTLDDFEQARRRMEALARGARV
jgi:molybdopterin-guanine dinucleotide biosynthesis protein A